MAPAAARTRPAWPAWTSVRASALRPDDQRRQRCLHHDRGYPRLDGCLVLLRRHLGRRRSLDGYLELRLRRPRHLDVGRNRPDERHLGRAGLRRPDRRDARLERLDERQGRLPREHPDVVRVAHQDVAPGRDCCRPCGVHLDVEPGTGCCRPDGGAAEACRKASQWRCHSRRCLRWRRRRKPGTPEVRASRSTCSPGVRRRCASRVRLLKNQRSPRRQVPMKQSPRVRVLLRRVQRQAWPPGDEVHPAWARSPPWGSRVPERVSWRPGRPHGPCERRVLPVSRTVP